MARSELLLLLLLLLCDSLSTAEMDHRISGDGRLIISPGSGLALDGTLHGKALEHPNVTGKGGDDDASMESSLLEITEADQPVRRRVHPAACVQSLFITGGAGVGVLITTPIHESDEMSSSLSLSDSDTDVQINKLQQFLPKSGGARSPLSTSGVVDATRPEPAAPAGGGKSHDSHHIAATLSDSELNSDDKSRLISPMIMIMIMTVYRAYHRKRSGRGTCYAAAALTILLLLVAAAFANSASAARPFPGSGHDEVAAAAAAAAAGKPLNDATARSSSCTTDPNTHEAVPCIHH